MATGVKPRDEDHSFTRSDLEAIQDAMKNKKFRDLLSEYCEEVRDPANQALYQKEMTQLEKERGYDVTFINPKGCYVIKTSVAGDRKAFINICSNMNVGKPSYNIQEKNGQRGMNWQIPYSLIPPREDYDHKRERCIIYDVVFHPDTLRMAEVNKQFREIVNKTALDGLHKTYNIHLDSNNLRFPKSQYKGMTTPAVIRTEDPNFKPPEGDENEDLSPDILEKLYPQRNYSESSTNVSKESSSEHKNGKAKISREFSHVTENGYTLPKYIIKQQKNIDLQDYTYNKDSKHYSAIPSHIVVEINLPLLSSTKDCILDVQEKSLSLISEKPAKYKLNIDLPYSVNENCGHAKFDKTKQILIVTLPVIRKHNFNINNNLNSLKIDSGVESEENSCSQSDEENNNRELIVELSSANTNDTEITKPSQTNINCNSFFLQTLNYILPTYTHNVLDNVIAFTFHVRNTDPQSVEVKHEDDKVYIKFTSIGSGFVPIHYAAIINFNEQISLETVSGEAWDNNVILQLELDGDIPKDYHIGIREDNMTYECFDVSQVKKTPKDLDRPSKNSEEDVTPEVEVTNSGTETNIVLSSKHIDYDEDEDNIDSYVNEKEIVWIESNTTENGAKSILHKPASFMRSYSESSVGDVASSMDYISSDCIPEESSLKKTVRFNNVIAKQFYRYNSSIEGQKKKNQRKKSKKRNLERRKSESEAEDDSGNFTQTSKPRLKSVLKQRRDSGLADTSDAEAEFKTSEHRTADGNDVKTDTEDDMPESVFKTHKDDKAKHKTESGIRESKNDNKFSKESINIKHNTDLYNPDRLNKGKYLEVDFKNDLIFDLDM